MFYLLSWDRLVLSCISPFHYNKLVWMMEHTRVEQAQLVGPHSRFGWAKLNGVLGEFCMIGNLGSLKTLNSSLLLVWFISKNSWTFRQANTRYTLLHHPMSPNWRGSHGVQSHYVVNLNPVGSSWVQTHLQDWSQCGNVDMVLWRSNIYIPGRRFGLWTG